MKKKEYIPKGEFQLEPNELGYVVHNGVRHDKEDDCPWCHYDIEMPNNRTEYEKDIF